MSHPPLNQNNHRNGLPNLGVGLGLRRSIFEDTMAARHLIDWLEIIPENYMGKGGRCIQMLEEAMDKGFPIISHGVNLSIGSVDPLNETYLADLKKLFQIINPSWFSDHLCFSSVNHVYFNDLLPLPFTWEAVHHIVKRIQTIQSQFEIPFLLENISYYTSFATSELTEAQFMAEVLERADCGLLLDVNNIYVNATNHGYDPIAFLSQIPVERTVQIHVAGHIKQDRLLIDTHGAPVCPDVWSILSHVLQRVPVQGVLLERDTHIPPMTELLEELSAIRQVMNPQATPAIVEV